MNVQGVIKLFFQNFAEKNSAFFLSPYCRRFSSEATLELTQRGRHLRLLNNTQHLQRFNVIIIYSGCKDVPKTIRSFIF